MFTYAHTLRMILPHPCKDRRALHSPEPDKGILEQLRLPAYPPELGTENILLQVAQLKPLRVLKPAFYLDDTDERFLQQKNHFFFGRSFFLVRLKGQGQGTGTLRSKAIWP
jgi:hypothetical protein